jgi:AraC-like DNA-binding protein
MPRAVIEPAAVEVVSTTATPPANGFEQCGHACGCIATATLVDLHVSVISADPHTVVRQPRATGGERGHVYVTTPLRGFAMVSQDDRQVTVPPGEIVTFDTSRPYTLTMPEPFRMVAVRTQHQSLGPTPDSTRRLGTDSWSSLTGIGALAGGPRPDRRTLMASICRTARECLADSELNPAMLARRHSISLRSLQMLFAEHDTSPARWIRDERLHRVRADLTDPRLAHLTVAMIGERWGLVDASQVSRLFRAKFGVSPSRYRKNPAAART